MIQLLGTLNDQCQNWNGQYDEAMALPTSLVLPPQLTELPSYKAALLRAADPGITIQFLDGTTKLRALVRTASGCGVSCDLAEFKSGGLGCSSGDTKVLGHACAHLIATANKSGKNIEEFYPQHKTTAHLKAMFSAGGKYPTPPDQETIAQHKEKFDTNKHIARVLKAKTGRKKRRRKGGKEIAMEKKARKATRAKAR